MKIDLNDRIAVEIAIIQKNISLYLNHHGSYMDTALIMLQEENNKLEKMKEQYPEYFI